MTAAWRYQHVGDYLDTVRRAHAALIAGKRIRMWWGDSEGVDRVGFSEHFMNALHRRITLKAEPNPRGRKDCPEWVTAAERDQRALRSRFWHRERIYQFETDECRRRFGHRLSRRDE